MIIVLIWLISESTQLNKLQVMEASVWFVLGLKLSNISTRYIGPKCGKRRTLRGGGSFYGNLICFYTRKYKVPRKLLKTECLCQLVQLGFERSSSHISPSRAEPLVPCCGKGTAENFVYLITKD